MRSQPAGAPSDELVRSELNRILGSSNFQQAVRASRLLRFLVEQTIAGRAGELKEYVVGLEVFDKGESFDPRADSSVRVEIARLRTRLHEYFHGDGADDPVAIHIPKGGYTAVFERRQPAPGTDRLPWRLPATLAAAALAVAAAVVLAWPTVTRLWSPSHTSLAVLPFLNLAGDPDTEYLSEGFVDELTATLGEMPELQVVARTSAFQFKGKQEDVRYIARRLLVGSVLEGSIQRAGERLKVTAQLIDGGSGYHRWSQSFECGIGDTPALRDEIARLVGATLGKATAAAGHRGPVPPEVQALYWQGLYLRGQRDSEQRRRGATYLEQAVAKDPSFAPASAQLAFIYASRAFHAAALRSEWVEKARASAQRALSMDESLPEAHAALAFLAFFCDWDWARAEREYRRALQLNPSYASAHNGYALGLVTRSRFVEAIAESRRARQLDPLSFAVSNDLSVVLYCAHREAEAERNAREVLQIDPGFMPARVLAGMALAAAGRSVDGIREIKAALATGEDPDNLARLAGVQGRIGEREEALAAARRIEALESENPNTWFDLALVHTGLGDKDRAFECLEQSRQHREPNYLFVPVDPAFDPLHGDLRFGAVLKQLGLAAGKGGSTPAPQ